MDYVKYIDTIKTGLELINSQAGEIDKAAKAIAEAVNAGKLVHIMGTDQESTGLVSGIFFKPGTMTSMDPLFDPSLDPAHGAYRNEMCLEVPNLLPCVMDYYEYLDEGDPIILIGSNPEIQAYKEAFSKAKEKKLCIIAVACKKVDDACFSLSLGEKSFNDGTYTSLASALLQMLIGKAGDAVDASLKWSGSRFVDLEADRAKIDREIFRVRHI